MRDKMSDWKYLNRCRIPPGKSKMYGSRPSDGFNGAFHITINGLELLALASDGMGWQHVSVSIARQPTHTPSWHIMCACKNLFWEDTDTVMQLHPPKALYVNHHPGCLHLWKPTMDGVIIPLPHPAMLGWEMEDGKSALEVPGLPQEVQEWIEKHYGKRAPE
jgi:hypothetical protein